MNWPYHVALPKIAYVTHLFHHEMSLSTDPMVFQDRHSYT